MAISGDKTSISNKDLKIGVATYNKQVGDYQGEVVNDKNSWASSDDKMKKNWLGKEKVSDAGYRNTSNYNSDTVMGKYVLKGKAGITANFYRAFSDAFDYYKNIIKKDLAELETNPNIKQAFSGTDIETAVKNLLLAVEREANDYLFKLEQDEKTVIHGVEEAFRKQQSNMGSSMESDTAKLSTSNSTSQQINNFSRTSSGWYNA